MKRRLVMGACALVALTALYLIAGELKSPLKAWYADNYMPRATDTVAGEQPGQICLTLGADPKTTLVAQWSTAPSVADGAVEYREAAAPEAAAVRIAAQRNEITDPMLKNDPVNHRFSAAMGGLKPETKYQYRVGSPEKNAWSEWTEIATAPESGKPFSFVYMGDPQQGLEFWGKLLHTCKGKYPDAAFYLIAGDLVDRGKYRDEWDVFFNAAKGVFDRRAIVPVLGNHDYSSKPSPEIYLKLFTLPENGPVDFPKEHAYAFHYGDALFVILDANRDPKDQAAWLDEQLKNSTAKWKLVSFHQPIYSSSPNRDNPELREVWGPIFDTHHVDVVMQGHDHAYLRTPPMCRGQKVTSYTEGTIYVVSVSGTKYYKQVKHDYAAVEFPNVSTYQIVDIATTPKNSLTYRAYDIDGTVKDEFVIEK